MQQRLFAVLHTSTCFNHEELYRYKAQGLWQSTANHIRKLRNPIDYLKTQNKIYGAVSQYARQGSYKNHAINTITVNKED